jgi:hypothetical protein
MAWRALLSGSFGDDGTDSGPDALSSPRLWRILASASSDCGTEDVSDDMTPRYHVIAVVYTIVLLMEEVRRLIRHPNAKVNVITNHN